MATFNLSDYLNKKQLEKEIREGDVSSNFVSWVYIILLVSVVIVPVVWFVYWLLSE